MNPRSPDDLIMLLSTDWFFPYWFVLGIGADRGERVCLQEGSREIVKQIMSGARDYWHVRFSEERIIETDSLLKSLLQKCRADRSTAEKISALIRSEEAATIDEGTGWSVLSITERLFRNAIEEDSRPSSAVREALARAWAMVNLPSSPETDFEHLCLSSKSDWDTFVRNTAPDMPTRLADYVTAIASKNKFELFWASVNADLAADEREELLNWYRKIGESMTGEPLRLR